MKRSLPALSVPVKSKGRGVAPAEAIERWNPGIMAATEEVDNTISILDVIGEDFFSEGVTSKRISAALRKIGNRPVTVNINSPGGDFFEGLAIYNMLREHPAEVTVNILGLAASAAAIIAMAGDTVKIGRAAFLMIHNGWVVAVGNKADLRAIADWMEPFDEAQADVLAARSGMKKNKIIDMLDKESWISGQKAVDDGFADEFLTSDSVKESPRAEFEQELKYKSLDSLLAKAGMSRTERKKIANSLSAMTRSGEHSMTSSAVAVDVLNILKSTKIEA